MSGKFMKVKRIIIPTLTVVMIASSLLGCSSASQDDLLSMINKSQHIEIEVVEPDFKEQGEETAITWEKLDVLKQYESFRTAFDNSLDIKANRNTKYGVIFVDSNGKHEGNTTLLDAFNNKQFVENYWLSETTQAQLEDGILSVYADLEDSDVQSAIVNAYWNLLPDNLQNYFNGGAGLTRAEAMTLLARAITPVQDLEEDKELLESTKDNTEYIKYATVVLKDCYIDNSDGSLDNKAFNSSMSRGEYVYMLIKHFFGEPTEVNKEIKLSDCKNGGDIAKAQKFEGKELSRGYELKHALKNTGKGAPEEIYNALCKANELGIIDSETAWTEAITKSDAIEILTGVLQVYSEINGYKVDSDGQLTAAEQFGEQAKQSYQNNKDKLNPDCTESEYTNRYIGYIETGFEAKEAESKSIEDYGLIVEEETTTAEIETVTESVEIKTEKVELETEAPTEAPVIEPQTEAPTEPVYVEPQPETEAPTQQQVQNQEPQTQAPQPETQAPVQQEQQTEEVTHIDGVEYTAGGVPMFSDPSYSPFGSATGEDAKAAGLGNIEWE